MKKSLFAIGLLSASLLAGAQSNHQNLTKSTADNYHAGRSLSSSFDRNIACNDTIRYPFLKDFTLTNWNPSVDGFYTVQLWTSDAESISQAFHHTSGSITIRGVEFLAGALTSGGATNVVVNVAIYSIDANNNPLTQLGVASSTITNTTNLSYTTAVFSTPITVTGNYAVVITPTNTNGRLRMAINDVTPAQVFDENLSRIRGSYTTNTWATIPSQFTTPLADFEPIVAPIITYNIATSFTAAPASPACTGTQINFTNTTTPSGVLSSRMYNYDAFKRFFGLSAVDSTYAWDISQTLPFSITNLVWAPNTSHNIYNPRQ